jgi:uncharacterized membrane protein YbhN (UPF0104 family)
LLRLNKKYKSWLFTTLKIVLSVLAIVYVLKKVALKDVSGILLSARTVFLIIGLFLFVASKVAASFRTLLILNRYSVSINWWGNLKLYWTGMFYNLFLPGGIGGDVYKTVIINRLHASGIKTSAGAIIMDRVAGVVALTILAFICMIFTSLYENFSWVVFAGIPLAVAGFSALVYFITPGLKGLSGKLLGWSFLVQVLQVLCIICILLSFNIDTLYPQYLLVFLISSIAAMLPISIGGIGVRELVFYSLSEYFFLDQGVAVTVSITFFIITAFSSLWGGITAFDRELPSS